MKRFLPVLTAVVLIILIVGVSIGLKIKEKYSYSNEIADLNGYYGISSDNQVAVVMQDEILSEKGLLQNGECYLPYDMVCQYFVSSRFYVNETDNTIRYALPDRLISYNIGETSYMDGDTTNTCDYTIAFYDNDTLYMAVDFIRLFVVFDDTLYTDPDRIQINTSYNEETVATISKDTAVRIKGGIKSDILTHVASGDQVKVLESMDTWSKIKTSDAYIGYVQNSKLKDITTETPEFANDSSTYGDEEYTSIQKDYKINMAWHQVSGVAGNDTLDSLLADTESLNTISPTWFYLSDNDGNIESYASQSYVDKAHADGLEVWALCNDFTTDVDDYTIFSSSSARENLIEKLMNQVQTYGIDGLNIDFEKVSEDAGPHYVEFIRELSIACRNDGIVLSVDDYPPSGGTTWYNREEQGVFADYVIVMGYDENYAGGGTVGSVASIDYVQQGIEDTLESVPASKLINAIPFYTRIWQTTGTDVTSKAVGMSDAQAFIDDNNIDMTWDETTCQYYGEIQKDDTYYQIWLEDSESIKTKLNVMENYSLAGVAEWKLGLETSDVWDVISDYVNQ